MMMRPALTGLLILLAAPAMGQPVDESLFSMQYFAARTAHICGVTSEAEARRLAAAIAAYYGSPSDPRDNKPRIAPGRLAQLRAGLDKNRPNAKTCESAPRYVPHLQQEYPPGGKVERNPPGSAAWDARVAHTTNATFIGQARACNIITQARAVALLARSEAAPALAFHWTPEEIADATAMGVANGYQRRRCATAADTLALVEEKIAEAETGWKPAD